VPHWLLVRALLPIIAALALVVAGCSGGKESATAPGATTGSASQDVPATTAASQLEPAPETAEVLARFVDAAGAGDVKAMWQLLSSTSKARLGPNRRDFRLEKASGFQRGLGSFSGTDYQVVLATETDSGWGVAAIAGERTRGGEEEFAAFGVALRREDGEWKLELGAPLVLRQVTPPRATTDVRPPIEVGIEAEGAVDEAGLWLDGSALPATATGEPNAVRVTATPESLAPGWHVLTILGRSGDEAGAGATAFFVEPEQGATTADDVQVA
jgi:hypothetical protein